MLLSEQTFYGFGCYPNPSYSFTIDGSPVTGVDYYFYVDSVAANNVYINPGLDTLAEGDSIFIPSGTNTFDLFFFGSSNQMNLSFRAVGTPTVVGESHPCQINNNWISNLGICPDGLFAIQVNACAVQAGAGLIGTINSTNATCNGICDGSINITISGGTTPYTFQWNNNATTQNLSNVCAGNYTLVVTDGASNTINLSAIVSEPSAILVSDNSTPAGCGTCTDGSASLSVNGGTPPYTIVWTASASEEDTLSDLLPGYYTYSVSDSNGCSIFDSV